MLQQSGVVGPVARANNDDLSLSLFLSSTSFHTRRIALNRTCPCNTRGSQRLAQVGVPNWTGATHLFTVHTHKILSRQCPESCYAVELLKSTKLIAYGIPVGCPVASLVMVASFHACQVLGDMKVPSKPSVIAHRPVQVSSNHIFSAIPFSRRQMMP